MSSQTPKPVTVRIFDKEYTVGCPEGERNSLFAAVELLNERMTELRDGGKVIGSERIAVISALNLAHELLKLNASHSSAVSSVSERLSRLHGKVEEALARSRRAQTFVVDEAVSTDAAASGADTGTRAASEAAPEPGEPAAHADSDEIDADEDFGEDEAERRFRASQRSMFPPTGGDDDDSAAA